MCAWSHKSSYEQIAGAPARTLSSRWWGFWIWMINKKNKIWHTKKFEARYDFSLLWSVWKWTWKPTKTLIRQCQLRMFVNGSGEKFFWENEYEKDSCVNIWKHDGCFKRGPPNSAVVANRMCSEKHTLPSSNIFVKVHTVLWKPRRLGTYRFSLNKSPNIYSSNMTRRWSPRPLFKVGLYSTIWFLPALY